ncbi:hypothetical protein RB614_06580 [Phytohabitans sp. ZYX-F-186]|uniref:DUF732 domain-containing protein n=1 Tax=Phytohabitans maris TaxID=3071409 RepID=A0ABU0ZAU4_9ACTN|nr:hypothetical protein [Phytohabitans sp. ZYX-F-186]MDQ7904188.1 hypothetical protein [Phytohabitans sp. ZYX-F-186]
MARRVLMGMAALVLALGAGACGGDSPDPAPEPSQPASTPSPGREGVAGIAPEPDQATALEYVDVLIKIDRDIVHNEEEKAVDRGRDLCAAVKRTPDDEKTLVEATTRRFTSPNHPKGFGEAKSKRILAATRKYICPSY